jgi:hypothetical protein
MLEQHPAVRHAAVLAAVDPTGTTRLVAYVVTGEATPTPLELRRYLRRQLPDAMVPAAVVPLSEMPLTPAGKVDLPRLALTPAPSPVVHEEPAEWLATATEALVCRVWAEVQGAASVSPTIDFFDSGGHSLQAIGIVGRIERELGVPVPLALIFEAGTPRELARRIDQMAAPAQLE